jgi:hypothetical protein
MNKCLNNFLDKVEGKPEKTTNKNIKKEIIRQYGARKQDFNFTKTGNWQKIHKLDYK